LASFSFIPLNRKKVEGKPGVKLSPFLEMQLKVLDYKKLRFCSANPAGGENNIFHHSRFSFGNPPPPGEKQSF
jgi:hypothetical protein